MVVIANFHLETVLCGCKLLERKSESIGDFQHSACKTSILHFYILADIIVLPKHSISPPLFTRQFLSSFDPTFIKDYFLSSFYQE